MESHQPIKLNFALEGFDRSPEEGAYPVGVVSSTLVHLNGIITATQYKAWENDEFEEYLRETIEQVVPEEGTKEVDFDSEEFIARLRQEGVFDAYKEDPEYYLRSNDVKFNFLDIEIRNPIEYILLAIAIAPPVIAGIQLWRQKKNEDNESEGKITITSKEEEDGTKIVSLDWKIKESKRSESSGTGFAGNGEAGGIPLDSLSDALFDLVRED